MKIIKLFMILLATLFPISIVASVSASKSSIRLVKNIPSTFFERYHISDEGNGLDICNQATSTQGVFQTIGVGGGLQTIGTVSKTLTVNLNGTVGHPYTGNVNESVRVPYSVIKKAQQLGISSFSYNRNFNFTGATCIPPAATSVSIGIKMTNPNALPLHVSRIQLYFANKRADITANKNQKLSLSVDLKLYGKGLLKGYWEVDGRLISRVYKQINYSKTITLKVPKIPGLPTYEVGTHRVRFVITSPEPGISLPQAIYFVKEQPSLVSSTIKLIKPKKYAVMDGDVWEFIWEPKSKTDTYMLEFYKKNEKKPIFSALSRTPAYTIPGYIVKKIFNTGGTYSWKVSGYNSFSNQIGVSETRDFLLK